MMPTARMQMLTVSSRRGGGVSRKGRDIIFVYYYYYYYYYIYIYIENMAL